jgi:Zn-dependent protease with chaperone function
MKQDEFDSFAEQSWTDSPKANLVPSIARDEGLSPAPSNLTSSAPLYRTPRLSSNPVFFRIPFMDTPLASWSPAERESFFTAIARHRRAAWRVHSVSLLASTIAALVVALLLSPLFYVALSLLCDLANLLVPTVNLAGITFARISPLMDDPGAVTAAQWLGLAVFAAMPGLVFMLAILFVTQRAVILSGLLDGVQFATVAPDSLQLEEQRFRNVVGEMAIAAGLAEPRVLIADWPSKNGAVFGANDGRAVVVVSRQLIRAVDRAQLQAAAAHLVGSIANGDMAIGVRVATTLGFFGLIARLGGAFTQRASMVRLIRALARVAFRPTPQAARAYVDEIAQPFRHRLDAFRRNDIRHGIFRRHHQPVRTRAAGVAGVAAAQISCGCDGRAPHARTRCPGYRVVQDRGRRNAARRVGRSLVCGSPGRARRRPARKFDRAGVSRHRSAGACTRETGCERCDRRQ